MDFKLVIFHLLLAVHFGYGIYYYTFKVVSPPEIAIHRASFGGHFKYLTYLNLVSFICI